MTDEGRLPASLEVSSLIRRVAAAGGFAAVLKKGEPDAGTIALVCREKNGNQRLMERLPQPDGTRLWTPTRTQVPEEQAEFDAYLSRRGDQDPDLWIVELDIPNPERFIGTLG
jgi:hypothetical protein